jgi:hypothetical protein
LDFTGQSIIRASAGSQVRWFAGSSIVCLAVTGRKHFHGLVLPEKPAARASRESCPSLSCGHVARDAACTGYLCAVADRQMRSNSSLAAYCNKAPESCGSGNSHLRGDEAVPANRHVVGDLYEVIELRAFADERVTGRPAIDGRVCAYFDAVLNNDASDLENFYMSAFVRHESEAVLPDRYAWMDNDVIADSCVRDDSAGADRAMAPDGDVRADHDV